MEENSQITTARARLEEKFGAAARIGGKSGARVRKRLVPHKAVVSNDEKKLQATIKRMSLNQLPGVDNVTFVKEDGRALCFSEQPKIQAAINANTFIITGAAVEKDLQQVFNIPSDIDPELLKKFAEGWKKLNDNKNTDFATTEKVNSNLEQEEDDEDVPDLVEDFELESRKVLNSETPASKI